MPLTISPRRLAGSLDAFDPRQISVAVARTIVAVATVSVLVFTPPDRLFVATPSVPSGLQCEGPRALSMWCATASVSHHLALCRAVAVITLLVVASGFRPRITCIPHWYVTFSVAVGMASPNGGDVAAQVGTLLLIPIALGDSRVWQWTTPVRPISARWQGASAAGILVMRLQVLVIYGEASVYKMFNTRWRDGTAMSAVVRDPDFGVARGVLAVARPIVDDRALGLCLDWSVMLGELLIAALIVGNHRHRRVALWLVVPLHVGIALLMGLPSFGATMIGLVLLATVGPPRRAARRGSSADLAKSAPPSADVPALA